jgi:hypothetical protein
MVDAFSMRISGKQSTSQSKNPARPDRAECRGACRPLPPGRVLSGVCVRRVVDFQSFSARNSTQWLPRVNNCDLPGFKWGSRAGFWAPTGSLLDFQSFSGTLSVHAERESARIFSVPEEMRSPLDNHDLQAAGTSSTPRWAPSHDPTIQARAASMPMARRALSTCS